MKKIISIMLAIAVTVTVFCVNLTASADPDYTQDNLQLFDFENHVGNGANKNWGNLTGQEGGVWNVNGQTVNKFTEGSYSCGIQAPFIPRASFFHNFVWNEDTALIQQEPHGSEGVYGVNIIGNGYKYLEFDIASEYDIDVGRLMVCLCGDVEAWHGYNATRTNVKFKGKTWYHISIPVNDFEYGTDSFFGGNPDTEAPTDGNAKFGLTCAQRIRFEIDYATDPTTGEGHEEVSFYFDDLRITRGDAPAKADTLDFTPVVKTYEYDINDVNNLVKYNGTDSVFTLPQQVFTVADDVFAGKDIKKITIGEQVTSIGTGNFEDIDGIIIIGVPGSYAETYANDNGLTFKDINDVTYGDVDENGKINSSDALTVLQSVVGIVQLNERQSKAADVDGSKKIDTSDALSILQYTVNIIDIFPIETM